MKRFRYAAIAISALLCSSCLIGTGLGGSMPGGRIIDHEDATVEGITAARIADAKADLVVAYWHTSHGNQLLAGMAGMDEFYASRGWSAGTFTLNGGGGLRLSEPGGDVGSYDGSDPHDMENATSRFQEAVQTYLNDPDNAGTNVVMASWCGQIGYESTTEAGIDSYLARMSELEEEYPRVVFVYMTGHSDGGGPTGQVHRFDQRIRDYCEENGEWLYDFYDIECYDPDGEVNYGNLNVTDNCDYDSDGNGTLDGNWATEWQDANPGEWWDCSPDHTQPLNGNRKAKAAWQLWCAIAEGI